MKYRIAKAHNYIKKHDVYLVQFKKNFFSKWRTLSECHEQERAEALFTSYLKEDEAVRKNKKEKRIVIKKSY